MKKFLMVMALAMMLVWGVGIQGASAGYMDPVAFYVVDDNTDPVGGDDSVTMSFSNFNIGSATLQYSLDNTAGSWTDVNGSFTVKASDWTKVYMRLNYLTAAQPDTSGDVTFDSPEGDLYNTVFIEWDQGGSFLLSVGSADSDDNVAPVPLPAAAWLLGSGLFGLIGIRRRMKR